MSLQTFIDMGDNESIQSAMDDMENARDRANELHEWLWNRATGSNGAPVTDAASAFEDMAGRVDQAVADIEAEIEHAKEAMAWTPEARADAQAERDAQEIGPI